MRSPTVWGPAYDEPDPSGRSTSEDARSMTAFRWILYCLVAFGVGTGAAFAMHPPEPGIPAATAQGLAADLIAIKGYAAEGRCDAVRGRLDGAQSKISKLPPDTSAELVNELQQSLQDVSA